MKCVCAGLHAHACVCSRSHVVLSAVFFFFFLFFLVWHQWTCTQFDLNATWWWNQVQVRRCLQFSRWKHVSGCRKHHFFTQGLWFKSAAKKTKLKQQQRCGAMCAVSTRLCCVCVTGEMSCRGNRRPWAVAKSCSRVAAFFFFFFVPCSRDLICCHTH